MTDSDSTCNASPEQQKESVSHHSGAEPAGELGSDGHVGQASLFYSVHHSHVRTQETRVTYPDRCEHTHCFGADDPALQELRDHRDSGADRAERRHGECDGLRVGESKQRLDDE